eukprot:288160_1
MNLMEYVIHYDYGRLNFFGIRNNIIKLLIAWFMLDQCFRWTVKRIYHVGDCDGFIGDCYMKLGQYKKANTHFLKTIELNPTNANYYIDYADFLQKLRYIERAKIYFEKSLHLDPSNDATCYSLAKLCRDELNDYSESERYYLKAISLKRECHGSYAYLLYLMKDYEKALHHVQRSN